MVYLNTLISVLVTLYLYFFCDFKIEIKNKEYDIENVIVVLCALFLYYVLFVK